MVRKRRSQVKSLAFQWILHSYLSSARTGTSSRLLSMPQVSDQNDPHAGLGRRQHASAFHLGPRKRAYAMVASACVGAD
jgi:hypothetical protein